MNDYRAFPELIPRELIDRAARLSAAQLCDGMNGLGLPNDGCLAWDILPVHDTMRVAGTACTVQAEEGDNVPLQAAIYQAKPGYVIVVGGGGYDRRAYLGDLLAGAAEAIGIEGIVIDGYIRDKLGLQELGLPVFAKGYIQRIPAKRGPGAINGEIQCGGIRVVPGDLVVGDCDGVTVVPRGRIEEVLERAEKKGAYELARRKEIEEYRACRTAGLPLPGLAPDWLLELLDKNG